MDRGCFFCGNCRVIYDWDLVGSNLSVIQTGNFATFVAIRPGERERQRRFAVSTFATSTPRQPTSRMAPLSHEAAGANAATMPARITTAAMASASAPSSTNSPASSRNGAAKFLITNLSSASGDTAVEQRDASERGAEEQRDESEDRQIRARPVNAEALAGPEQAERRQHHPDRKFQRILRNARQWPVQHDAAQRHQHTGGERRRAHRQQHAAAGADRNDDEDDFQSFQQHGLEACETGQPVEPLFMTLFLSARL